MWIGELPAGNCVSSSGPSFRVKEVDRDAKLRGGHILDVQMSVVIDTFLATFIAFINASRTSSQRRLISFLIFVLSGTLAWGLRPATRRLKHGVETTLTGSVVVEIRSAISFVTFFCLGSWYVYLDWGSFLLNKEETDGVPNMAEVTVLELAAVLGSFIRTSDFFFVSTSFTASFFF